MTINDLSRRNFLKGGAAVAALGGFALAGCTNNQEGVPVASTGTTDEMAWDKEADVVILGSGLAGMYGAITAANAGASVIILEKQDEDTAGGDGRCNGGVIYDLLVGADGLMGASTFGKADPNWAYAMEEAGLGAKEWLVENGINWMDEGGTLVEGNGPAIYECLLEGVNAAGVEVLYETPGHSLIVGDDGEVHGVRGGTNGDLNVKANKGVIIATGSYACNEQMMSDFNYPGLKLYSTGSPYNTGDGIVMAGEVGARLGNLAKDVELNMLASVPASEEMGTGITTNIPAPSLIYVNGQGERFMNEYEYLTHSKNTLSLFDFSGAFMDCLSGTAHYPNKTIYEVFDQACFDAGTLGNTNGTWTWAVHLDDRQYIWSKDNTAELEKGWIIKADTLEELAEKIGVDAVALTASVAAYNEGCAANADAFGRIGEQLGAIGEGPYYAMELGVSFTYTIGGLVTDAQGRTLNWRNEPIGRLYSAGCVGMNTDLSTVGINGSMAQGCIAAQDAVTLEPWAAV